MIIQATVVLYRGDRKRDAVRVVVTRLIVGGLVGIGAWTLAVPAQADECPNKRVRRQEVYALALPDCRAYEQVSPVSKNAVDALGATNLVQSSAVGDGVTFFTASPFPEVTGAAELETYVSVRNGEGWSTQGLLPHTPPNTFSGVTGLIEDLSLAFVEAKTPLFTGEYRAYLCRTGEASLYRCGGAPESLQPLGSGVARFADATPNDSRIIFGDEAQLLPEATPGVTNLYEWANGKLALAGVLPNGKAPAEGSAAGPREGGSELGGYYTSHTISRDGSRITFTDRGTGQIYVRVNDSTTIQVAASQESPPAEEHWLADSADGRYVFFSSEEKLTVGATASPGSADLYRFDVQTEKLADLTTQSKEGAGIPKEGGMLGISDDGSYAYFVAVSVLASNENKYEEVAQEGHDNLYEWHEGVTSFIARLSSVGDEADWLDHKGGVAQVEGKTSRVTPDGKTLLLRSEESLTRYNNVPPGNECVHSACYEFYLFTASSGGNGTLRCLTCSPLVSSASHDAFLNGASVSSTILEPSFGRNGFLTRNLSNDGSRVFFQTAEALVPQDTNGQKDVYEWKREGSGSCSAFGAGYSASVGGCISLISSGQSGNESYFGDASVDGNNVFFFTRQSLVGQDQDNNVDVYDARVEGGFGSQNPPSSAAPCTGGACRGMTGSPPLIGAPASTAVVGIGNLAPQSPEVKPVKHHRKKTRHHKRKRRRRGRRAKRASRSHGAVYGGRSR
jgi:hypothetical protein